MCRSLSILVSIAKRRAINAILAILFSATATFSNPLAAAELRCPPRLPGPHPGFEQVGPIPTAHWLLWRMRLFDAQKDKDAPAELAPSGAVELHDRFRLTWQFTGSENLLIVCLYDGSGTYYRARPQPLPEHCTMSNDNGPTQAWCEQQ
jgi:hypothetical protein